MRLVVFAFLLGLTAVAAQMTVYGNPASQTLALLDFNDISMVTAMGEEAGVAYLKTRIIEIDTCTQKNHRDQPVTIGTWTHRSDPALTVPHDSAAGVFLRYSIGLVFVPIGIVLELCEPDFSVLRESGTYVCNEQTIETVIGNCKQNQDNAEDEGSTRVNTCTYVLQSATHQMLRYRFADTWGCHESAGEGYEIVGDTFLNRKLPCSVPTNARLTTGCAFACNAGYTYITDVCVHDCAGKQQTCLDSQYAESTCNAGDGESWYACVDCDTSPGSLIPPGDGITAFASRSNNAMTNCEARPCAAGEFGLLGICKPCAAHSFTNAVGQSTCTPCAWGYHLPSTGGSACIECFASPLADEVPCPQGQQLHLTLESIENYGSLTQGTPQNSIDDTLMHEFCAQGFACLPCMPGQFALDGRCESCEVGTYQPWFGASSCFACSTGQVTPRKGATSSDECICLPGFA